MKYYIDRRGLLTAGAIGAAALSAPTILKAQTSSGTPVVGGKRVRRRLSTLADDDPFFEAYGHAVELMHKLADDDPLSWIAQARTHADFCAHGTLEFLPWHRPYLANFERICGVLIGDPDFALPYWHWADNQGRMPQPFFDNGPLNVLSWDDDGSYFGQAWGQINSTPYRFAEPNFGLLDGPAAGSFSDSNLSSMESAATFQLLSSLTENPHGTVHVVTGGNPMFNLGDASGHFSAGLSPLDPIFWLHHANVDRIWAQSGIAMSDQISAVGDPSKVYAGIFHDENGDPVSPVLGDQFDFSAQDYTYDFLVPELLVAEALAVEKQIVSAQPELVEFAASREIVPVNALEAPPVLANSDAVGSAPVGAVTRVDFDTENIADVITSQKLVQRNLALLNNAIAIDTRRIYARFKDVKPDVASQGNLMKVFIDCPYLSDIVPTTDPHCAGLISFFGCTPDYCAPRDFTLDITEPLQYLLDTGALSPSQTQLQLLPFTGNGAAVGESVADFGEVELIIA